MFIMDDGIRLHAELEMPPRAGEKCPLVIVIHGFTGNCEEPHILEAARVMREAGFATLRADMYGHGQSDGEFRKHTLYKWIGNLLTLIDYARSLPFVRGLYLCGHSQGGLTVMLAAGIKNDEVDGVIALSPAVVIPEDARRGDMLGYHFDPDHVPDVNEGQDGRTLEGNYIRVAQTIHVEEAVRRYKGPVLVIHGDADETVPLEPAEAAARLYSDGQFVRIPGDTHCYDFHLEQVAAAVKEWLEKRSGERI